MKKLVILSVIVLISVSCGKKCPCFSQNLLFAPIQFSDAEADTIIIRRYMKGTNFLQLRDTIFANQDSIRFKRSGDTLNPSSYTVRTTLPTVFDYEIYFPGAGKTFRIDNIVEEETKQPCGGLFAMDKVACFNPITSYRVNNQLITGQSWLPVYLKK